jgi:F0F1-type ATP synthase delta subunit
MLAATSRRLAKNLTLAKRRTGAPKTRKCSTQAPQLPQFPSLKLPTYKGAELKKIEGLLEKINADPVKRRAVNEAALYARTCHTFYSHAWALFAPLYGVAVPEPGLKRDVLTGMVISTLESWSEFVYALRAYQSKLQLDPAFYQANQALRSKDAKEAEQARNTVISFIRSIPTKSELAQRAVLHLVRRGQWEAIKSGKAAKIANEYMVRFKREVKVELTTAHKLTAQELEHWTSRFKQAANDERTKIIVTTKEDPSILGGAIVSVNGDVYDESWKRQQEVAMEAIANFNSL